MSSFQGGSWTTVLLWCVQVRARATQTSTAVWIQWKRFCFQSRLCHRFSCQIVCCGAMLTVALCHVHKHKYWFSPSDPIWFDAAVSFPIVCGFSRTNALFIPVHVPVSLQKVEDTVGALEAELASLLEAIDAPKRRPLLAKPGEETVDAILEEARRVAHSSVEEGLMSA